MQQTYSNYNSVQPDCDNGFLPVTATAQVLTHSWPQL